MAKGDLAAAMEFKLALEKEFEVAAALDSRAYYSAIYSLPQQSPVMWINLNPGGTLDDHRVLSDDQLAQGKHEFWHGFGKTSKATGAFLQQLFDVPLDRLRSVQGTNVAWERSREGADIDLKAAARRAAPFLARYIQHVDPTHLVFGGAGAFDLFIDVHRANSTGDEEVLKGNWGTRKARVFTAVTLDIPTVGRCKAITISHPSRGVRSGVLERCRAHLSDVELPLAIV